MGTGEGCVVWERISLWQDLKEFASSLLALRIFFPSPSDLNPHPSPPQWSQLDHEPHELVSYTCSRCRLLHVEAAQHQTALSRSAL